MPSITLTTDCRNNKYGIVKVFDTDGTIIREYKISESELAIHHASIKGSLPDCTRDEWESGRVVVYGKCNDIGDINIVNVKGANALSIVYKQDVDARTNKIVRKTLYILENEYKGVIPNITVDSARLPPDIISLIDGQLVIQ